MNTKFARRRTVLLVTIPVLLIVGGLLLAVGLTRQQPAPPRAVDSGGPPVSMPADPEGGSPAPSTGTGQHAHHVAALPVSRPVRVTIPSIKVSSTLEELGLAKDKTMETPRDPAKAGWFTPGPTPGAQGPSVIAGHVTWNGTPSVFFKLGDLAPGDRIDVQRQDGRTARFTVDRIATYAKDDFPTVEVYRNTDQAALRLITCGGTYSKADHYYPDNVVVYATLTGSHS